MGKGQINLQDAFLNQVRKEKIPVTIYLVNGFQIKGIVKGFDNFTVNVEMEQKQQLVYKHAISTVAPIRPIGNLSLDAKSEDE
jgi:host factor-I protein